jgi:fatty acid desaturase
MHTREGAQTSAPVRTRHAARFIGGMTQATLTALAALACCMVLIAVGAAMSICWEIHPLLMIVAAIVVVWLCSRLAGHAFRTGGR